MHLQLENTPKGDTELETQLRNNKGMAQEMDNL